MFLRLSVGYLQYWSPIALLFCDYHAINPLTLRNFLEYTDSTFKDIIYLSHHHHNKPTSTTAGYISHRYKVLYINIDTPFIQIYLLEVCNVSYLNTYKIPETVELYKDLCKLSIGRTTGVSPRR